MSERMISAEEYDQFRSFLTNETGIVLGDNKHYLVSSRLNRLMDEEKLENYSLLLNSVKKTTNGGLRERVIDAMTTNETMWFRDSYPFEILKSELLPEIDKKKDGPLRIWSAACSSGQEPHSLSITIQEYIAKNFTAFSSGSEIVATDISGAMIKYCKQGIYDESAMRRGLSEERKQRFFKQKGDDWELKPEIRSRINFRLLNLQQSYSAMGKFDIIFCRNVLIYFSPEFKTDILNRMGAVLKPGGYLFLGSSETPTRYTSIYKMIRTPHGVIYRHEP